MKKIIICVLCFVGVLMTFCSCSEKNNDVEVKSDEKSVVSEILTKTEGVPESVVLRNVSIEEDVDYEIVHNYDSDTHIDDIELITVYSGKFGKQTKKYTYSYQYDRSSDLWSLIDGNNGLQSDVIVFNEKAYSNKNFKGEFDGYHSGTYDITIEEIDFDNRTVKLEYLLTFDDGSSPLSDITTLEICDTSDDNLCFAIEYNRSMVVMFEELFIFDINEGLIA